MAARSMSSGDSPSKRLVGKGNALVELDDLYSQVHNPLIIGYAISSSSPRRSARTCPL